MNLLKFKYFIFIDIIAISIAFANTQRAAAQVPMHTIAYGHSKIKSSVIGDARKVWQHLSRDRTLATLLLAAPFLNFIGAPLAALLPALVKMDWHLGVANLAIAESVMMAGVLSSVVIQSVWTPTISRERLILFGLFVLALAVFMVGGWTNCPSYILYEGMFIAGFASMLVNIPLQAAIAANTPETMRGRVTNVTSTRVVVWIGGILYACMLVTLAIRLFRINLDTTAITANR